MTSCASDRQCLGPDLCIRELYLSLRYITANQYLLLLCWDPVHGEMWEVDQNEHLREQEMLPALM